MKSILKAFAHRNASESGFAMPVAIGFGLVTLLVAGTLLLRSQDDQATAKLQRSGDSSLNTAEAGVTRIQSFLNSYRSFAKSNLSQWSTLASAYSTSNVNSSSNSNCGGTLLPPPPSPTTLQGWQTVTSSGSNKGWYRLVDYSYNATTQKGTLIVDGASCVGDGCAGMSNTAPPTNDPQISVSRLKVTLPVQADVSGLPGLWLTNGVSGSGGSYSATENNQINGNVLINDCRVPLTSIRVTGSDPSGQPYVAQYTLRRFPNLPTQPATNTINELNSSSWPRNGSLTLPRPQDRLRAGVQAYEYLVQGSNANPDLSLPGNLTITPGQKVIFYLQGSIRSTGTADISHNCTGNSSCTPTDFQIFGYQNTGNPQICLNGTEYIDAFIFAPNYTIGVAGSAGGTGGFRGSVWAREWSTSGGCGSNTSNIVVTQTANWNFGNLASQDFVPIDIAPITCWERLENNQTTGSSCN